jgi:hypothetical protein
VPSIVEYASVPRSSDAAAYTAFVGVDPGVGGGLVMLRAELSGEVTAEAVAMPDAERDVWDWVMVRSCAFDHRVFACVELVGGWVGSHGRGEDDDGTASNPGSAMFTFGQSYGALRMALVAAGVPFEAVRPQAWQRALGLRTRERGEKTNAWKNYLKGRAQALFPQLRVTKAVADALLIAEYCRRKWGVA